MRSLSLSPLTVLPCAPVDQIDIALDCGYRAMGLRLFPTLSTDVDIMAQPRLRREIVQRLAGTGLTIFDIEVVRITPDLSPAMLEPAVEFAASLGARWLAATALELDAYSSTEEPAVAKRLAELGELTARYDMGVMLEFMAFRGIRSLSHAARIIEESGSSHAAITLDALHFFRTGGTIADLENIDPRIVSCIQLSDAPAGPPADLVREARQNRLYPGEGGLPLRELVKALPNTPLTVEVASQARAHLSGVERAREAMSWTRDLLGD